MKDKLRNLLSNKTLENLFHVGTIKFVNIFSKYLLIGYLIRTIGETNYGTLTWVESFVQYFVVYVNFGFDLLIIKKIIENKNDKYEIDKIISTVLSLKMLLFLSSFIILSLLLFLLEIHQFKQMFYLMLVMAIGEVFFPLWYFQGIQKMKYLSITAVVSKVFLIFGTVIFVTTQNNSNNYIIILVLSNFIYGGLGYYFLQKTSKFTYIKINYSNLKEYFKDGFLFYLGKTSTLFMNFGTIFLIGKYFSKSLVTGFDVSSKIIFAFIFIFEVIQQSFFSQILISQNKKKLKILLGWVIILSLCFNVFVYVFSTELLHFMGGEEMKKYSSLLEELSILIPIVALTTVLGSCGLVAFGGINKFNYTFLISALIYILTISGLISLNMLTFENLIFTRIFVDVFMLALLIFFATKLKIIL